MLAEFSSHRRWLIQTGSRANSLLQTKSLSRNLSCIGQLHLQARFETGTIATPEEVCRSGIMTSRQCCLLAILGRTTLVQAELAVTGAICGAGTEVEMMTKKESMLLSIVIYSAASTQHGPAGGRPPWQAALSLAASLPADPLLTGRQGHLARALGSGDYSEIQGFYSPSLCFRDMSHLKPGSGFVESP